MAEVNMKVVTDRFDYICARLERIEAYLADVSINSDPNPSVGRSIDYVRCHIEAGILSSPKNAIHHKDKDIKGMKITPIGIYVETNSGVDHLIPYSNTQVIRLLSKKLEDASDKVNN
jgi:hypothetical protein